MALKLVFNDREYEYKLPGGDWPAYQAEFGEMLAKFMAGGLGRKVTNPKFNLAAMSSDTKRFMVEKIKTGQPIQTAANENGLTTTMVKKILKEMAPDWKNPRARQRISPERMQSIKIYIASHMATDKVSDICQAMNISPAQYYKILNKKE